MHFAIVLTLHPTGAAQRLGIIKSGNAPYECRLTAATLDIITENGHARSLVTSVPRKLASLATSCYFSVAPRYEKKTLILILAFLPLSSLAQLLWIEWTLSYSFCRAKTTLLSIGANDQNGRRPSHIRAHWERRSLYFGAFEARWVCPSSITRQWCHSVRAWCKLSCAWGKFGN